MNQLIDPQTKEWNVDLVRQIFHSFDADEICKLKIPRSGVEDCIAWHYEKTGVFTVKSAYKLADSLKRKGTDKATSSSREPGDRSIWDAIWKAKIPEKVKVFGWRVATNSLPTKHNVFRRTMVDDSVCEICGRGEEDEHHATITCTRSVALRQSMRAYWKIPKESEFIYTGEDWLQLLLFSQPEEVRTKIMLIMWQAWSLRNNVVHGDGKDTVAGSVQYLLRLHDDLLLAECDPADAGDKNKHSLFPGKAYMASVPVSNLWAAPPPGKAKLNVDAAFLEESGEAWGGHAFLSVGRRLTRCNSAQEAEGAAVVLELTEFSKFFNGHVILETDCAGLGRVLQAKETGRSACYATLADAKTLLSGFAQTEISIINRGKNKLAHELAATARRSGDFLLVADVPMNSRVVMRDEYIPTIV